MRSGKIKKLKKILYHLLLSMLGFIMIYPLLWLFFSSFKSNKDIFGSLSLLPKKFEWRVYIDIWSGATEVQLGTFMFNSIKLVVPLVCFTVISSVIVAYGFARFDFPLKKILFSILIGLLMMPSTVILIPRYIIFRNLGWLNTYLPFYVPALLACNSFFVFMFVQFLRGLPYELDEAATIDGCSSFGILFKILLPLCKPAIFSAGIFQFMWGWDDFLNSLIFINSVKKFTLPIGLRMTIDVQSVMQWNRILAMSVVSILPPTIIFFTAQKYFVEGITLSGLKG